MYSWEACSPSSARIFLFFCYLREVPWLFLLLKIKGTVKIYFLSRPHNISHRNLTLALQFEYQQSVLQLFHLETHVTMPTFQQSFLPSSAGPGP